MHFTYQTHIPKLDDHRPFYLISRLVTLPSEEDQDALKEQMKKEKLFRDILLVSDVSGKKQNFAYFENPVPHMFYIDLGCSFVDSVNGILIQRQSKRVDQSHAEEKANRKIAGRYAVRMYDGKNVLPLDQLGSLVDAVSIPLLNNSKKVPVTSILSAAEIAEIKKILNANVVDTIRRHKGSQFLSRI